jgi:ABC-type transporter Mla subunit MlaD
MENVLLVSGIVGIIALIVVCVFVISAIRRLNDVLLELRETVGESKRMIAEVNRNLPQTFATLNQTGEQLQSTLKNVDVQVGQLGQGLEQFKEIGTRINGLEAKLQDKIEGPLMQAAGVVSGISKAITTFVNGVSRR